MDSTCYRSSTYSLRRSSANKTSARQVVCGGVRRLVAAVCRDDVMLIELLGDRTRPLTPYDVLHTSCCAYLLLASCYLLHATNYLPWPAYCSLLAVESFLYAAHYLLLTAVYRLTTYYSPPCTGSVLATHCRALTHYSLLTTYYLLLTTHDSLLTTHYLLHTSHYSRLTTHYSRLTTYYSQLAAHCSLLTTYYILLTTHDSLLTTHDLLLTTHNLLLTAHYSRLTTYYSQLAAHCSLLTTYYLLLTTCCSLLTARHVL